MCTFGKPEKWIDNQGQPQDPIQIILFHEKNHLYIYFILEISITYSIQSVMADRVKVSFFSLHFNQKLSTLLDIF